MKRLLRFSVSGLVGLAITAALFIGMLSLLNGGKKLSASQDTNINFSFVNDYEAVNERPRIRPEKPEQQETTSAPDMPKLPMEITADPDVTMPAPNTKGQSLDLLSNIKLPGVGGSMGTYAGNPSGGLKSGVAPMFPPKELMKKVEGWVKVLITVNEFGHVSSVKVLNAKPARVFNAATIKAVKKWKFYPKLEGGQPVPYQVTQTVEFKIDQ